jgi:serine/threonine protein kinase
VGANRALLVVEAHRNMIDGLFTFPRDILLEPIESIPETVRAGFQHKPGDFALTRPHSRTHTHVVSSATARLLQIFREPTTIADAIIAFSRTERGDPAALLDEAFPALQTLIQSGLLLPSESHLASPIAFVIEAGKRIGDLVIEQPVALVVDSEVYRCRTDDGGWVALKIARPGSEGRLRSILRHEAEILRRLEGTCSPRLVGQGEYEGRPYIAMEWLPGVDAAAAAELPRMRDPIERRELTSSLLAIVDAYVVLHEQRVIHGDVHPRNVLVCPDGCARIIDFGHAHHLDDRSSRQPAGRGVVDLYMEPELARARLDNVTATPTPLGEQYSLAALLYFLMTGAHTHDFVLEERQMLQQVVCEPPRTFVDRGLSGFEHVERTLQKALDKQPEGRFASLRVFRDALREALDRDRPAVRSAAQRRSDCKTARALLLDELIARSAFDGQLMTDGVEPPSASVNFGSAGLAFAMLRLAQQREDALLLAVADIWSDMALRDLHSPGAFTAPDLEMSPDVIGQVSFYHSSPGVFCVAALVADAQADDTRRKGAVQRFITAAAAEEARSELVFGVSGLLVGCSFLLDAVGASSRDEHAALESLGGQLSARLLERLDQVPTVGDAATAASLGVAHGYAGMFYALLLWARMSNSAVHTGLQARLRELGELAQPAGRGLGWPVSTRRRALDGMRATWCNGAAGHLHLWLLAYELLHDPAFLTLAEGAAWTTYEAPGTGGDLCCGAAGRAYALLRFFRQTGDRLWLERATELAEHAAKTIRTRQLRRNSLYRGEAGVSLLAADLDDPHQARMPLFEP